ncbi:MAG: SpoIIE family protein phosphatase, partial [Microscillaceae bacterium]|nr:SpoIIE family protein phosphatase [Microscillaceae bacterium]
HLSGLLFAINFLDLRQYLPGRSRFFYWAIPISLIFFVFYLLTQGRAWLLAVHLSGLTLAFFTIFSAFQISPRRHPEARFYLYAYGLLILGALPVIGGAIGLWAESWFTQHGFELGILAEVLTLSLALTDKQRRSLEAQKAAQAETIRVQQEANQQLEEKVRFRTAQLREASEEIASQRDVLEEQNRNIMASIQAARRIQEAVLPSMEQMRHLCPDFFVFYQPLQVVSGDLFWWEKVHNKLIIAAIDCTGHGVPGAFQSLLAYDLLNRVVVDKQILDPATILNEMHRGVVAQMKASDTPTHYGMDAALCVIDIDKAELSYCGAHNPLIYFQAGHLYEVKGARIAIGDPNRFALRSFETFRLRLDQPTTFYLFSDGLQDQFGGPQNRKFTPRRLRELLYEIHLQPLVVQGQTMEATFRAWQGGHKQIDDVLVMGFRWQAGL